MATKDYGRRITKAPRRNLISTFLLIFLSFVGGYLTANFFDFSSLSTWISKRFSGSEKTLALQHPPKKVELTKPKFEFYTLLAKDSNKLVPINNNPSVKVASLPSQNQPIQSHTNASSPSTSQVPVVESKPIAPTLANKKDNYLVQIAAFSKLQDAEHLKASLLLTGYDASLSPILKNQITWYRVMVGPFSSQGEAEKAKISLAQRHKMNGMIKKA